MSVYWEVKKGNTNIQDIEIKDKAGVTLTNLAETSEIKFQVKKNRDDSDALIEKTKSAGIVVNSPSVGFLRITLDTTDTDIAVGVYYMGLQLKWAAPAQTFEIDLFADGRETEKFKVIDDVVS